MVMSVDAYNGFFLGLCFLSHNIDFSFLVLNVLLEAALC